MWRFSLSMGPTGYGSSIAPESDCSISLRYAWRGAPASELGLAGCLDVEGPQIASIVFPGKAGRWEVRHGVFREGGLPHQLLVISDVSRALREEERQAWQRLIRVLGHELNNSLAPIKSVAENLAQPGEASAPRRRLGR